MTLAKAAKRSGKSYELPFYIRKTSRIMGLIHPRLGLWFALQLFFTPIKFPIPEREKPIRKRAQVHDLSTGKRDFQVFEWGAGEKRIILMHGWSGRASQFFKIIEALLAENFHVYSIEAPAHGASKQQKTHLLEFVEAIDATSKKFGKFRYGIGHSLGGIAIFNCLKTSFFSRKSIVTIGTPSSIRAVVYDFCDKIEAKDRVAKLLIKHIENTHSMRIENFSPDQLAGESNPKGLIIHDIDDLDVDVSNADALNRKWPNANLLITERLGHRRVLMENKVIETVIGFLSPLD